ncbi:MAG: type II toxin-antitoxin system Phd/YefM family antitoxin [Syntrophorhabdales bacterium]|jgi:prevent-host-death family protein
MKEAAATDVKNRFGQMLEAVMSEPIAIEKKGRPVAVMMSIAEYERLVEIEDRYWGEKALKAVAEGFVSDNEIKALFEGKLGAKAAR